MDAKSFDTTCSRDVISWLPDEVLGKILSSLSTKQAASTSVLSKKWRYVFRLVDNLDFDDYVWYDFGESFKDFVDRTLALQCDFQIKKFSLTCCIGTDKECQKVCLDRWISNVLERGVLELELRLRAQSVRYLPSQLFVSKTLVKLSLRLHLRKLPSYVSLPSLKILFIDVIVFEDNDLLDVLLAGCPVLEELTSVLAGIPLRDTISNMSVKRLSVRYDCCCGKSNLSLDMPNLMYLDYSAIASFEYPQVKLESLIEAKLNLFMLCGPSPNADVTNLIMGIKNVEILYLSPQSVDVLCWCCKSGLVLPVFNNLVSLSFGSNNTIGWYLLANLLKHSPKLENLTIKDLKGYRDDISMPLNQVKVLNVLGYRGTTEELKQLKSFLEKFGCIELVQVNVTEEDDDIILQVTKDLEMLFGVSVSSNCHVKVTRLK